MEDRVFSLTDHGDKVFNVGDRTLERDAGEPLRSFGKVIVRTGKPEQHIVFRVFRCQPIFKTRTRCIDDFHPLDMSGIQTDMVDISRFARFDILPFGQFDICSLRSHSIYLLRK